MKTYGNIEIISDFLRKHKLYTRKRACMVTALYELSNDKGNEIPFDKIVEYSLDNWNITMNDTSFLDFIPKLNYLTNIECILIGNYTLQCSESFLKLIGNYSSNHDKHSGASIKNTKTRHQVNHKKNTIINTINLSSNYNFFDILCKDVEKSPLIQNGYDHIPTNKKMLVDYIFTIINKVKQLHYSEIMTVYQCYIFHFLNILSVDYLPFLHRLIMDFAKCKEKTEFNLYTSKVLLIWCSILQRNNYPDLAKDVLESLFRFEFIVDRIDYILDIIDFYANFAILLTDYNIEKSFQIWSEVLPAYFKEMINRSSPVSDNQKIRIIVSKLLGEKCSEFFLRTDVKYTERNFEKILSNFVQNVGSENQLVLFLFIHGFKNYLFYRNNKALSYKEREIILNKILITCQKYFQNSIPGRFCSH